MLEDFGAIVQRLQANLQAAEIPVSEADMAAIKERGALPAVMAFEALARQAPADSIPGYLADWGETKSDSIGNQHQPGQLPSAPSALSSDDLRRAIPLVEDRDRDATSSTSIWQIAPLIERRVVSPVELTEAALRRIDLRDPVLNAYQVVLADQARVAAHRAEQEVMAGNYHGPLHGIPVAVKDLLAMKGTVTTAGSKILGNWRTEFNASAVDSLEAAGAVIVGKTRMSEFAYSPGSNNAHYGATRNPWNLERDAGGSSSGSAAAVADGLAYGALGSDTGGSIRMPAALCGIVGFKPTFGRVSLHGAVGLSWSLDHLGPLTRSVRDAALMLSALAGYDSRDLRTRRVPVPDFGKSIDAGVKGLRIGVLGADGYPGPDPTPEAIEAWRAGLAALERNGAALIPLDVPEMQDVRTLNTTIVLMEAAAYHLPMMQQRLHDFGEFMRYRILSAYALSPIAMVRVQQIRTRIRARLDEISRDIDLLSTPTMPYGAPELGDPARNITFTAPFNTLGWPAITVPAGLAPGNLPLGLQLIGKPWDEVTVLRAASVVEADGPWKDLQVPADRFA